MTQLQKVEKRKQQKNLDIMRERTKKAMDAEPDFGLYFYGMNEETADCEENNSIFLK